MRKLLALILFALSGCSPEHHSVEMPSLPEELKDCKVYYIANGTVGMYVMRCPNSTTSTTYRSGKTNRTSVVVSEATQALPAQTGEA